MPGTDRPERRRQRPRAVIRGGWRFVLAFGWSLQLAGLSRLVAAAARIERAVRWHSSWWAPAAVLLAALVAAVTGRRAVATGTALAASTAVLAVGIVDLIGHRRAAGRIELLLAAGALAQARLTATAPTVPTGSGGPAPGSRAIDPA